MSSIKNIKLTSLNASKYVIPLQMNYIENGVSKSWDLIQTHASVAVVIFNTSRKTLVCVKQFRPGVYLNSIEKDDKALEINTEKYPWDIGLTLEWCAGIIDKDKSIEEIASDEIIEECGYYVPPDKLELIQTFRSAVGVSGDVMTMFFAEVTDSMKTSTGGGLKEEGEIIEVVELTMDEATDLLKTKSIKAPGEFLYGLMWFFMNKSKQYI